MARATFGGGIADFVTQSIGGGIVKFAPATLSFYSAKTGGTRYSDLLLGGSAASTISVGTDGQVPQFQGPDGVFTMWADGGGARVQMVAVADAVALATAPTDTTVATAINTPGGATATALAASIGYKPGYDIVILAGQSNMSGRGVEFTATTDPVNPRIFQWKTHDTTGIQPATEPLDMQDVPSGIGPGLQFARWYAARRLDPTRKVLLVPTARGGTPLVSNATPLGWRRGVAGNLYANMVTQAQAAKTAADAIPGSSNRIIAFLWCQGETDGDLNATGADYQTDLDALINGVRTDLSIPDLPAVLLTMVPEYLSTGTRTQINAIHRETPFRIARTDVAVGAAGANKGDGNHYNAAGQRLNGRAMFDAYDRIVEGLSPYYEEFRPVAVGTVTVTPGTTTLTASWAAATRATSYTVEYRVTSVGGTWSSAGTTTSTSKVITGLTNGTQYDVRVTAVNAGATATPSTTAAGTPQAITTLGITTASPLGAYSTARRVVSTYSGPLLRVRNGSTNVETDIGQSAAALDTAALTTALGGADGYIVTLYDQSGNGKHVSQATTTKQPKVATAGTVVTSGGKPASAFDGVDDILSLGTALGVYAAGAASAFVVLNAPNPGAQKRTWAESASTVGNQQYGLQQPDVGDTRAMPMIQTAFASTDTTKRGTAATFNGALHQLSATDTGAALSQWLDGVNDLNAAAYTRPAETKDRFAIGGVIRSGTEANLAMTLSELVIFGVAVGTTDRQAAEANQKAFYTTP